MVASRSIVADYSAIMASGAHRSATVKTQPAVGKFRCTVFVLILCSGCAQCLGDDPPDHDATVSSRHFDFRYAFEVRDLPTGNRVRVWVPVPQSTPHQSIEIVDSNLPAHSSTAHEQVHGNRIAYFDQIVPASGRLEHEVNYRVRRNEVRALNASPNIGPVRVDVRAQYLAANRLVPNHGPQLKLLQGADLTGSTVDKARALYDVVDRHVRYDKSKAGYGRGDVLWVCDSRFGNCTDFHSLFISLARASGIPASFEIGFPIPPARGSGDVGGYHCWAYFFDDTYGRVPVDISEADKHPEKKEYFFGNLTPDRVAFSVGRDIRLWPAQDGPPLNYFIYPYAEVDGRPWPQDKITAKFSYADVAD